LVLVFYLNIESPQAIFRTGFFFHYGTKNKNEKQSKNILAGSSLYYYISSVFLFFSLVLSRNVLNYNKRHKRILWVVKSRPLSPTRNVHNKKSSSFSTSIL